MKVTILHWFIAGCVLGGIASPLWLTTAPRKTPATNSVLVDRIMSACTAYCRETSNGRTADKAYDILFVSKRRLDTVAPDLKKELQQCHAGVLAAAKRAFENAVDAPFDVIVACYFLEQIDDDSCVSDAQAALGRLPYGQLIRSVISYPTQNSQFSGRYSAAAAIRRWIKHTQRNKNSSS